MKKVYKLLLSLSLMGLVLTLFISCNSEPVLEATISLETQAGPNRVINDVYTGVDIADVELLLINIETDQIIEVDLKNLTDLTGSQAWPKTNNMDQIPASPQHTWTKDGKTIYVSTDASDDLSAFIVVLDVKAIYWDHLKPWADVSIVKKLRVSGPNASTSFPDVEETTPPDQHVVQLGQWARPSAAQAHGPAFIPHTNYSTITEWTGNRFRIIDISNNEFTQVDGGGFDGGVSFGEKSQQTHGLNFSPSGALALGTGYFYDHEEVDLYKVNNDTGSLKHLKTIRLREGNDYAAFTHYTVWLDDRFALTAAMQLGSTSLTPSGVDVIGPSVWLLDTRKGKAEMIIGPATSAGEDGGIFRSPSDIAVANGKLYVAEEHTLVEEEEDEFGKDGYISIFDISDVHNPQFIKRLKPETPEEPDGELPEDYAVSHGLNPTLDEAFVYVTSWVSNYILKIDTQTDEVSKVFSSEDGLNVPHGGFVAGQNR